MGLKVEDRILIELILIGLIDVPHANPLIVGSTEQQTFLHWVPSQSVSFLSVPSQTKVWFNLIINWCLWMFVIIKKIYFTVYGFCCYYLLILWHEPCSVNFTLMINLHVNRYSSLFSIGDFVSTDTIDSFAVEYVLFVISSVFT